MIVAGIDGCCKGNPGPGGWGVTIWDNGKEIHREFGGELETTNNRMELEAFLRLLDLMDDYSVGRVYIDSKYVLKGTQEWLRGWILNGWKNSQKKEVANKDLWMQVAEKRSIWRNLEMEHVKGHNGDPINERADALANLGYEEAVLGEW